MTENKIVIYESGQLQKVGNQITITNKLLANNKELAKEYYKKTEKCWNEKDYHGALLNCIVAIELDPFNIKYIKSRSNVNYELTNYTEVIKDCNIAIELDPKYFEMHDIYNRRGLANSSLGNDEEAIKDYNKSIELNQTDEYPYINRGLSNLEIKNYKEALKDFNKAIEVNPRFYVVIVAGGRRK